MKLIQAKPRMSSFTRVLTAHLLHFLVTLALVVACILLGDIGDVLGNKFGNLLLTL